MPKREKFGKFVLLEETEATSLGPLFRAAKLGTTGFEKIVWILKLAPAFSANLGAAKRLMDQVKVAAPLQNPNILKIYGIGKVEATYYIAYEFVEGKSLRQILARCQQDAFPLSADHGLLISSKICSALEAAHSRKGEDGRPYFHGMVNPSQTVVSYEGEIRVRGFGYWASRVRDVVPIPDEEQLYLAPEQASGGEGSTSADLFAVGATLFEMLTGRALFQDGRDGDVAARVQAARLQSPTGENDPLPPALSEILARSLTGAYANIQEMRKAIDTLLFSGDFTPTTFNLAFFMHSLFREDIDKETSTLDSERRADYAEFLPEEPKAGMAKGPAAPGAAPEPGKAAPAALGTSVETVSFATPVPATRTPLPASSQPAGAARPAATPVEPPPFSFAKPAAKKRTPALALAALLVVAAAGAGLYFGLGPGRELLRPAPATTVPPTLSPEAAAAIARVKELEQRLSAMEAERTAAEAKAAEEAKKRLEAQARAKGQEVDPAALRREEEDARKKARVEQEKRLEEERRRLEEQMRAEEARIAEERRRAEEQRKAEEAARQAAVAAPATPPPTTAPAVRPGMLVNLSDPGVIPPVVEKPMQPVYPQIALQARIQGTVELSALIDDTGAVTDVRVIKDGGSRVGLAEAAVVAVKQRKYRPATKDGVPVKVWFPVRVQFSLPK
jgi:TonB family protein